MSYDLRIRDISVFTDEWVRDITIDHALDIIEEHKKPVVEGDYYYDLYHSATGEHAFAYMADFSYDAPIWMNTADYTAIDDDKEFACYV